MAVQKKYPDELCERAVKMIFEIREREGKGHGELARVARQLGVSHEVRTWMSGRKLTAECGQGRRRMISSGPLSWRGRTASCAGQIRY